MPSVPEVIGQPRPKSITQPPIEDEKPAILPPHVPPSQDEIPALSIQQQTMRKPTMTPNEDKSPAYKFTDSDRKLAQEARWSTKYPWTTVDLDEALAYLAELRLETERGGITLQQRVSELKVERVKCFGCENIIDISAGRWAGYRTRNNFETGIPETGYACSAACMLKLNRDFSHPVRVPMARESS